MIDGVDDIRVGREESVSFCFLESERDRFLAEGAPDFLKSVELGVGRILDKVNVREAALQIVLLTCTEAFITMGEEGDGLRLVILRA